MRKYLLILFLFTLSGCQYFSLPDGNKELEVYYATSDLQDITDYQILNDLRYIPYQQQKIDFLSNGSSAVFKVKLNQNHVLDKEHVLVVGHKYLDSVNYLTQDAKGRFSESNIQFRMKPTSNRFFSSEKFVFNYKIHDVESHFIIVQNHKSSSLGIKLIEKDTYILHDKNIVIFFAILYSSMIGLFLVNFIYYLYIKNRSYLLFSLYLISGLITFYWQESRMIDLPVFYFPIVGSATGLFVFVLSNVLLYFFVYDFLKLKWKKSFPGKLVFYWILHLLILLVLIVAGYISNSNLNYLSVWYNSTVMLGSLVVFAIAYLELKKGNRQAGFLLVGWTVFLVFSLFRLSYSFNIEPDKFWIQHSYEIGLVIEAFILALGLADQALGFKKSKDIVQHSYNKANKALLAETLINNFLYEIKDEVLKETQVQNFIMHIENYFAKMVVKYAPVENITKLSLKSEICHKSILIQQSQCLCADEFFEDNKVFVSQACESKQYVVESFNKKNNPQKQPDKTIQIIVIPVSLDYNSDKNDYECLILEIKQDKDLNVSELDELQVFFDKAIMALMNSRQLKQIANHAQDIISQADVKDKAMRLKDRFFANVSHEFRTPLTLTIAPLKDLYKQREFLNTSGRYLVDTALSNAQDLMSLVDKILDIQQLEANEFPLKITRVNLNKLIYVVIKKLINWSLDHFQTLVFEKESEQDVFVYCDKKEIEKVIVNLVSNAIKYSGKNSNIVISLAKEDSWVKILIFDNGVGIEETVQDHIFERYYQGDSIHHLSEAGTGIGLSYVKDVMGLHSGKVTLNSRLNKGSEFTLWFKQDFKHFKYDEMSDSAEKSILQDQVSDLNSKNLLVEEETADSVDVTTLLIVEDNPELLKFLVYKFKDYYKIIEAENGLIGIDKALEFLPDLIISDVMMPEMDGMEMLLKIREINELKTVPVILLTAISANVDAIEGLETGADDYVTKPFDFDELKARVDRLISSRKAVREENISQVKVSNQIHKTAFQEKLDEAIHKKISDNNLNVEMLAELMYLDRSGLYRKVKAEFNMTPVAYIRQVRMEFAKNLLTHKKLTVSETAYACGYDSLSYFSKQFKKTYGTSPSDVL